MLNVPLTKCTMHSCPAKDDASKIVDNTTAT